MKGTSTSTPASSAAFSTAAAPARTITSASEILLLPRPLLKSAWIDFKVLITLGSSSGLLTSQSSCGASATRAPLAPPRMSLPRKLDAEAQAVRTSSDTVRPDFMMSFFSDLMSPSSTRS